MSNSSTDDTPPAFPALTPEQQRIAALCKERAPRWLAAGQDLHSYPTVRLDEETEDAEAARLP